jgi:hypothetical protein
VEVDVANDLFFGRGGKIVADSQRELKLKFELLMPVNDGAPPTACMSFNYHMDHLARCGISAWPTAAWPTRAAWASVSNGWCWRCSSTMDWTRKVAATGARDAGRRVNVR